MKHCLNCGAEFEGKFCPNCGAAWQEEKTCPQCGATLAGGVKFCNECGYSFVPNTRPPQNVEPQRSVTQPTVENRPKSVNGRGMSAIYALSRYLPAALLGLFAVLFFLFYLAPAAVMPGGNFMGESIPSTSYGSLYEILSVEELASLSGCAGALIAFAVILAVFACVAVPVYCNSSGRLKSCVIVAVIVCVLDFVLLLVGSILISKIGEFDGGLGLMKAGAAPILTVVFSCILLVFTAAAVGVRAYFEKKCPEFVKAYNKKRALRLAQGRAQKQKLRAEKQAEEEAKMEPYRATHTKPMPPEKIAAPKRPKKPSIYELDTLTPEQREELRDKYETFIRKKSAYAITYPLVVSVPCFAWSIFVLLLSPLPLSYSLPQFILLGGTLIAFSALMHWAKYRPVKGWDPKKVYRSSSVFVSIILSALFSFLIAFWFMLEIFNLSGDSTLNVSTLLLNFLDGSLEVILLVMLMVIGLSVILPLLCIALPITCKLNRRKKPLVVKMCGYTSPTKNHDLVEAYNQSLAQYEQEVAGYKEKLAQYRENRRAWTVYSYQLKKYEQGKEFNGVSYPKMWCSVNQALFYIGAFLLAAVIVVTCILATLDRRFTPGTLQKIGLGAEQDRVVEVLGEADEESAYQWTYYSDNYTSILEDMEEINEKSMGSQSLEQLAEYAKQYEALQEKLDSLEYQVITVTFSSEKTVTALTLDAHVKNGEQSKKVAKECKVSPEEIHRSDTISYAISYEDGSYAMRYFTKDQLSSLDFGYNHQDTLRWADDWGNYSADIEIKSN